MVNANPLVPAVTNTCGGAVTATPGGNALNLSGGSIAPGSSCAITVPVTSALAGTYVNVTGAVSAAVGGSGNTASATLVVNASNPAINLAKRISTSATGPWMLFLAVPPGTPLYYQFTAENIGDVPFNPFSVSDPTLAGTGADPTNCVWQTTNAPTTLPALPVASATIDPTATCVTGPITAALGPVTNTATAHGTFAGLPHNSSAASANYIGAVPGFSLVKQIAPTATGPWASAIGTAAGANVFYKFTVINTGGLDLNTIGVTDPTENTASCAFTNSLVIGQATVCVIGPVITAGANGSTTPNTAIAQGTNGSTIFTPPSTASYTIAATTADLSVTKDDGATHGDRRRQYNLHGCACQRWPRRGRKRELFGRAAGGNDLRLPLLTGRLVLPDAAGRRRRNDLLLNRQPERRQQCDVHDRRRRRSFRRQRDGADQHGYSHLRCIRPDTGKQ